MSEKKQRQQSEWAREKAAYGKVAKLRHELATEDERKKAADTKHAERVRKLQDDLKAAEAALAEFQQPCTPVEAAKP